MRRRLSGARVILVDDQPELGGSLLSCRAEIDGKPALQWVQKIEAELRKMPEVKILSPQHRVRLSGP